MLTKNNNSLVRCPKCNKPMRLLADPPHFAQFIPWQSFTCELCHICLSYPPDADTGTVMSLCKEWKEATAR